ncbi:MAG: hypothetical protein H0X69_09530, partial [Gemmatimonadales bacterium]|nr:hypothetical protein [Gemmatimonadales bacterium]
MLRFRVGALLVIICTATGCGDSPRTVADARDSVSAAPPPPPEPKVWEPRPVVAPRDTTRDSLAADTTAVDTLGDTASAGRDTVPLRTRARGPRPFVLSPADSARWPVRGPEPLPGALLPEHRIIAYYGNPRSTRMGIMGQVPPDSMLPRLEK